MIEFKLPKRTEDLRIKHHKALNCDELKTDNIGIKEMVTLLHLFTGVSKPRIYRCDFKELTQMFAHVVKIYSGLKLDPNPKKEIELSGQVFELVDFDKVPVGWHIDNSRNDYSKDPVMLACMCYVPKGTKYGEIDSNDNLLYPPQTRHELFNQEFPLQDFISLNAFFLRRLVVLTKDLQSRNKAKEMIESRINRLQTIGSKLFTKFTNSTPSHGTK